MGFLNKIFGKEPKVPGLPTIEQAQTSAINANVASFADIAKQAAMVDTYNQDQLAAAMEKQLPGGPVKIRDLISSRLAGEIPKEVLGQLRRSNAERNYGALTSGSQFKLGSELGAQLGMSLDLQNQGFNSALNWMQATKAPTFDVTSMFLSPAQKYEDQINQWNRQMMEEKIKAAPDPVWRGLHDTVMEMAGMAAGAMGGGGGGYKNAYNPNSLYGSNSFQTAPTDSTWRFGGSGLGFGYSSQNGFFWGGGPGKR